jgi:Ala-tRNA(Pro) deacylase
MPISVSEQKVLDVLGELAIPFVRHEHPPVATVEEAEKHWADLEATHCKNLFLRNKKGNRHFLVIAPVSKAVDLRGLNRALGQDRLSFASAERLRRFLGVEPGSVSPFGLINDREREVQVVLDEDLRRSVALGFHPNTNTATLEISRADFEKFLDWSGHKVRYLPLRPPPMEF